MGSTVSFATTKVTVDACKRYLLAYRSKGQTDLGQFSGDPSGVQKLRSLIKQMDEIVGSGQSKSLIGPEAEMLFAGSLFFA